MAARRNEEKNDMVTQERLKEILHYDAETCVFTWVKNPKGINFVGIAGTKTSNGYTQIKIDQKKYYAHRLAWIWVYGVHPPHHIDHVNRTKDDNRIKNLRPATNSENQQNQKKRRANNKSGVVGVCWDKSMLKWKAQIQINRKNINLGHYNSIEEAAAVRATAKQKYHTFHPEDNNEEAA